MSSGEGYGELEGRVAGFISRLVAFSIDAVLLVMLVAAGTGSSFRSSGFSRHFCRGTSASVALTYLRCP